MRWNRPSIGSKFVSLKLSYELLICPFPWSVVLIRKWPCYPFNNQLVYPKVNTHSSEFHWVYIDSNDIGGLLCNFTPSKLNLIHSGIECKICVNSLHHVSSGVMTLHHYTAPCHLIPSKQQYL